MASKNKKIGRRFESYIVEVFSKYFGLTKFVTKPSPNMSQAQIARAEEVSQHLDNQGVDLWFREDTGLSEFDHQLKSTLVTGQKSKSIDIQPLLDLLSNNRDTHKVLITEVKHRPGKRNMKKIIDLVTMELDTYLMLLKRYNESKRTN